MTILVVVCFKLRFVKSKKETLPTSFDEGVPSAVFRRFRMLAEGEAWLGEGLYLAQGWWAGPEGKAASFGEAVVEEGEETASERTSPRAS